MDFKKIPIKIYGLIVLAVVLAVLAGILTTRILVNHSFVKAYNKGDYQTQKEESLLVGNVPEGYLPYYNLGNVAFERKDYNSAIGYYNKALERYPVGKKECDIRINLALAMCYSIDFDALTTQEALDTAQLILIKARDILLENNWATDNGVGHRDDDAQQLKEDIDRMLEQLQNKNGDQSQDDDENAQQKDDNKGQNSDGSDQSKNNSEKEKRQKDKLDKNKKNAMEERQKDQDFLDKYGNYGNDENGNEVGGGGSYKPW
ncbi:tetratricopeptide repeat protein [Butyrivibrio sp. VCB2006]|uniref:tetratricopeptide repeat protein n=1 Tax=Butyrivibrio sp. VCB2006 TaxID=1280679 RepID=UPI0003FC91A3|nr:tetratricopeptide repeat protein [Butyrivibrio sp. VCB2006]